MKNLYHKIPSFFVGHPFVFSFIVAFFLSLIVRISSINWLIWLVALIVATGQHISDKKRKGEERLASLRHAAEHYVEEIKSGKKMPVITSPVFLDEGEALFLADEDSKLYETRAVRRGGGGFASVRVARGVRVGGYSGRSESTQEWRILDTGRLYLTNKKILFVGTKENRTIPVNKIIEAQVLKDGIQVSIDGRTKGAMFPVSNPYIWGTAIHIVRSVKDPLNLSDLSLNVVLK